MATFDILNKVYCNDVYRSCPQCNKMYAELCCAIDNNVMVQSSADFIILFWAFISGHLLHLLYIIYFKSSRLNTTLNGAVRNHAFDFGAHLPHRWC